MILCLEVQASHHIVLLRIYHSGLEVAYREQIRTKNLLNAKITDMEKKNEMMFWWSLHQPGETMTETQLRFYKNLPKAEGRIREHSISGFLFAFC